MKSALNPRLLLLLLIPSLIWSCSTASVGSDSDPVANFLGYRSFALLERPTANPNSLLDQNPPAVLQIEASITRELTTKGFRQQNPASADLLVAYHGGENGKVNVHRWGYSYGPRKWYGKRRLPERSYKSGTLVIDIIDARSRQLIWRGSRAGVISSPQSTRKHVDKAVEKILRDFPPDK